MKTAVAAPADPFEELFAFIDGMTLVDLTRFLALINSYISQRENLA